MNNLSGLAKPTAWRFGVWSAVTFGLGNLAWAQDDDSDQSDQVAQPDMWATYGERILILIAAGAIGFAVGAFFSPMAKPFRKFIWQGALAIGLLYALFGPSPNADILNGGVAFVVFSIALVLGLRLGLKLREHVASKRVRPTSFGSAKWATFDYLAQHGLFSGAGFVLGEFLNGQQRPTLRYEGARHMLTVAPTRSGKGVSSIIPNLLLHEGSALVIDPKGENALITAARRGASAPQGLGQKVILLDPWDIASSKLRLKPSRFNPLDWRFCCTNSVRRQNAQPVIARSSW